MFALDLLKMCKFDDVKIAFSPYYNRNTTNLFIN